MKKRFYKKLIQMNFKKFKEYNKKKLFKIITDGSVVVVKNVVKKKQIVKICEKINKKKMVPSKSAKMIEGIKNIYYKASPSKLANKNSKRYIVSNRSWYFFPWNEDKTGLVDLVQPVFNHIISLNGYDPKIIKENSPKDGIIQRFHLMNYPLGSGFISRHVDPTKIVKITAGIYITEYGKNYDSGGFYVLNKKRKKINIDKHIKSSDMVLFYASMPHGVDNISKSKIKSKKDFENGRWFLNCTLVSSHHVKNRITSVGY